MRVGIRKLLVTVAAAGAAAILPAGEGLAWVDWCETDPPVSVVTAGGHHVTVNNFLGTTRANRHLLERAVVFGYAEPAGEGASTIHVFVVLPKGGSAYVRATSKSGRFDQVTESTGRWGDVIQLELTVPVD